MIHAYNDFYLLIAQQKLGSMIEIAVYEQNIEIDEFGEKFINSKVSKAFEEANPIYILGKSANELLELTLNKNIEESEQRMDATPEYWVGWILAYTQWKTSKSFKEIINVYPLSKLLSKYYPLHEASEDYTVDIIKKYLDIESPLKKLRKSNNLSQNDLALLSSVSLRSIKGYEQGKLDLSKAQGETLYKLSKVLNCTIEDLLK